MIYWKTLLKLYLSIDHLMSQPAKKWQLVLIKQIKWALLRKCKTKNEKQLKKGKLKQRSVQRNTIKKSKRKQIISVHC